MNHIVSSSMSNMLDTTSSSEGMRAFKPGITPLVRLFCFPHNNPFASLVPGTATLQLQWQRLPWFCGTAGMLSCCNGKNRGVQTPSQPIPARAASAGWVLVCIKWNTKLRPAQLSAHWKRNSSTAAQQLRISRTGLEWAQTTTEIRNPSSAHSFSFSVRRGRKLSHLC